MKDIVPSWILWLAILIAIIFAASYIYVTWNYDHWKKKGVPSPKTRFPFGNFNEIMTMRRSQQHFYRDLYDRFNGQRYVGCYSFTEATLLVRDPELIKSILVRDFSHFHDRGFPMNEETDPMTANLFNLNGSRWHDLRNKLSPTFTSGKMRSMMPFVKKCAEKLQEKIQEEIGDTGNEIEVKDLLARYTTDVIGSVAFGVEVDSLTNPNAEFRVIGRRVFQTTLMNALRNTVLTIAPSLTTRLGIRISDPVVTDFFMKLVEETVNYRERNGVKRPDFLQLLIGLKNEEPIGDEKNLNETSLNMAQLTAQCFVFFLGGFETSATTLSFCLHELAQNTNVQNDLRSEVNRVVESNGGQITYEGLNEMHLMDRVISETLRKYPAVPILFRECTKNYVIPPATGMVSNRKPWKAETINGGTAIEMGTRIQIPIVGLHYDSDYFPDPECFDPDRFTQEAIKSRPPYAYLPFGEGPRICIGMRFGTMQTKAALAALLLKFEFRPSEKTPHPVILDKGSLIPTAQDGIWVKVLKCIN